MTGELQPVIAMVAATTILTVIILQFFPRKERVGVLAAWVVHLISAIVVAWVYLFHYGYGDLLGYARKGVELGSLLRQSFSTFAPEIIKLLFHQEPIIPVYVFGAGNSTGSMFALTGILNYLTGGEVYTACVTFAFISYLGKLAVFVVFRRNFPASWKWALVGALFIPSVVFWTSAPLKESVAVAGFGFMLYGIDSAFMRGRYRQIGTLVLGAVMVGLTKAYVLLAAAVALAALFLAGGLRRSLTGKGVGGLLAGTLLGTTFAAGGLALVGYLFQRFALENLAEEAARLQTAGQSIEGGSNFSLGVSGTESLVGQLTFAPFALIASLYRPFIFEVRNPMMLVNAIETTGMIFLTILWFRRGRLSRLVGELITTPWLGFAAAFVLVLGVGVGLATTNLGTLSRYRVPLMPLFFFVLTMRVSQGRRLDTA